MSNKAGMSGIDRAIDEIKSSPNVEYSIDTHELRVHVCVDDVRRQVSLALPHGEAVELDFKKNESIDVADIDAQLERTQQLLQIVERLRDQQFALTHSTVEAEMAMNHSLQFVPPKLGKLLTKLATFIVSVIAFFRFGSINPMSDIRRQVIGKAVQSLLVLRGGYEISEQKKVFEKMLGDSDNPKLRELVKAMDKLSGALNTLSKSMHNQVKAEAAMPSIGKS